MSAPHKIGRKRATFVDAQIPGSECPPPTWFRANPGLLNYMLVTRDYGPTERQLKPDEWPIGASMAFRRAAFQDRRFDPNLGRLGNGLIGDDEIDFCRRLQRDGYVGVWVPIARLQHYTSADRMTLRHVWRYFAGIGRTQIRVEAPDEGRLLRGAPRWF